jgi:hypothetical protein
MNCAKAFSGALVFCLLQTWHPGLRLPRRLGLKKLRHALPHGIKGLRNGLQTPAMVVNPLTGMRQRILCAKTAV